jgi:hypothetical protein
MFADSLKRPQVRFAVFPAALTGLTEQIGDEMNPGVPSAQHWLLKLEIRDSTGRRLFHQGGRA